jgi:hypothetical protein
MGTFFHFFSIYSLGYLAWLLWIVLLMCLYCILTYICSSICPEVVSLDHMSVLFLVF